MKWPWQPLRNETKSSGGLMVALSQLGTAKWGPREGVALVRDGYVRNAVAYRCVRMVAEAAASIRFQTQNTALQVLLDGAGPSFFEAVYTHLQLSGNAYIEALCLGEGEVPASLHSLRPDRMRAITDRRGWPVGWTYKTGATERILRPGADGFDPILHLKLFHPGDDIYGLSPLAAARQALDLHNASADWAKSLIDNAARPSGALIYGKEGARLSEDQFERLKGELESAHTGAINAGRPLLLEGGLDWKPMSLSPADMDFREARNGAAREIALAFGVPPMLLGIPGDNTFSNYREANLAFWRITVLPLVQKTAAQLTGWLGPLFEAALVDCDLDRVPALAEEREKLWRRLEAASFITTAEKREIAGFNGEGLNGV